MTALITVHHVQAVNIRNIWTHVMANDSQGQGVCVCVFPESLQQQQQQRQMLRRWKWENSFDPSVQADLQTIHLTLCHCLRLSTAHCFPDSLRPFGCLNFLSATTDFVLLWARRPAHLSVPTVIFSTCVIPKDFNWQTSDASFGWFHSGDPISYVAHTPTTVSVPPPLSVLSLLASSTLCHDWPSVMWSWTQKQTEEAEACAFRYLFYIYIYIKNAMIQNPKQEQRTNTWTQTWSERHRW